jgi:two-component system phosphate regulon response regulator PhoB
LRNIVFRFDGSLSFAHALRMGDQEMELPPGESVGDGEWVLAIFEMGEKRRATASAARGRLRGLPVPAVLVFDRRDWDRLTDFANAPSSRKMAAAAAVSPPPPSPAPPSPPGPRPVGRNDDAALPGLGQTNAWPPPPAKTAGQSAEPPARVLVVDDDPSVCKTVCALLENHGLATDSVRSAEDALARILADGCDLVVLDWGLPGMSGIELCRVVRDEPSRADLPLLFLSARSSSEDIVEAFARGADDYVTKPFRGPELGARVLNLLRRARRTRASKR